MGVGGGGIGGAEVVLLSFDAVIEDVTGEVGVVGEGIGFEKVVGGDICSADISGFVKTLDGRVSLP